MKCGPCGARFGRGSVEDIFCVVEGHTGEPLGEAIYASRLVDYAIGLARMDDWKV